MKDSW